MIDILLWLTSFIAIQLLGMCLFNTDHEQLSYHQPPSQASAQLLLAKLSLSRSFVVNICPFDMRVGMLAAVVHNASLPFTPE
jgi:hypothetical protein